MKTRMLGAATALPFLSALVACPSAPARDIPEAAPSACQSASLADDAPLPALLSETGYFDDELQGYQPLAPLWSDGAEKQRFVRLPCGQSINTVDIDNWLFPKGTMLWKDFVVDGARVETRVLKKIGDAADAWDMSAYRWNAAQDDAALARAGGPAVAPGWQIPAATTCIECHGNLAGRVIGFSALQLAHDGPGITLASLIADGRLTAPPQRTQALVHGWEATSQKALLALHGSCGHCHGAGGIGSEWTASDTTPGLSLRLSFNDVDVAHSATVLTAVSVPLMTPVSDDIVLRIAPGDPAASGLFHRMSNRGEWTQMPPLATDIVDEESTAAVAAFIAALPR